MNWLLSDDVHHPRVQPDAEDSEAAAARALLAAVDRFAHAPCRRNLLATFPRSTSSCAAHCCLMLLMHTPEEQLTKLGADLLPAAATILRLAFDIRYLFA